VSHVRRVPDPDHILVAQLDGAAKRHARWRDPTPDEEAAAVAELSELAAGRADLLAEVAGIQVGFHQGDLDEARAKTIARLCRLAGADETLIPQWAEEGRRRAAAARMPPPRYL
jgi:hypothetical protein